MATVVVPALMRKLTGGQDRIQVSGRTVGQLIDNMEKRFPGLRSELMEGDEIRPSIAVSIDGELAVNGLLDPVSDDSNVYFLPALGGG